TTPLRSTLERLVDFDRINSGEMRFSVGAVNIRSGNFIYFDSTSHKIRPEHIMASGALPPGCPAVEVDGELHWDGGLVSNTPLQWVVSGDTRQDTLTFQVDHWNAGYNDAVRTLRHPEALQRPVNGPGVGTFDMAVDGRE